MEGRIFKKKVVLKPAGPQKPVADAFEGAVEKKAAAKVRPPKANIILQAKFGLHSLKVPVGAHQRKKIKGRGPSSGHGKTSTRGSKGQTSRSGRVTYPGFEGGQTPLIRRIPKRGFSSNSRIVYQIINLGDLGRVKESVITPEILKQCGLIKDKNKLIKILGDGELKIPVTIQAHAFSKKAQEKIKNSGGVSEVLNA